MTKNGIRFAQPKNISHWFYNSNKLILQKMQFINGKKLFNGKINNVNEIILQNILYIVNKTFKFIHH